MIYSYLIRGRYTQDMPKNRPPKKEVRKIPKNFRLFAEDVGGRAGSRAI
jgi:hypothetical protein